MTNLTSSDRAHYVQRMFTRIAPRYDLMNRLMTAGQDVHWRREVIRRAKLKPGARLLDLGAGTGDLARQARRQQPACQVVAADFTLEMMRVGTARSGSEHLAWNAADARFLPYPDETFDAVISGFLLRNVTDLGASLAEQYRVLKPAGWLVALDTTPPAPSPFAPFIQLHLHTIIPGLGKLMTGQEDAYHYLPDSTESFLEPEQLAVRLMQSRFQQVGFRRLMFGTVAIHWGQK